MSIGKFDIEALADLLKHQDESSGDEDCNIGMGKIGPGDIGRHNTAAQCTSTERNLGKESEFVEGERSAMLTETRLQPEYDVIYKQKLSPEEAFFHLGNKNPSTASCEDLVVKVKLPGTDSDGIKLDVTDMVLDCSTLMYKLNLHLPHPVDSKNGTAEWDEDREVLQVTLPLKREYDFLNK